MVWYLMKHCFFCSLFYLRNLKAISCLFFRRYRRMRDCFIAGLVVILMTPFWGVYNILFN